MQKHDFHFPPVFNKLKRGGPAVTIPKDAGMIMAYTGMNKHSRIIEIGSGSGFMTVQMASIASEVVSYEKREEFLKLAESNVKRAELQNVVFKFRDVLLTPIDENDSSFDIVFVDIADAQMIVPAIHAALKKNGYLAGHCLQSEQAKLLHLACEKLFSEVFTLETIVREYAVRDFGFRPAHFGLTHTAYLVFARK